MNNEQNTFKSDFFVVLDFGLFRGVRCIKTVDADGDNDYCLCIPMTKNLINRTGKEVWRMYLSARKSENIDGYTHYLTALANKTSCNMLSSSQYRDRYERISISVGYISYDLSQIPYPPEFYFKFDNEASQNDNKEDNKKFPLTKSLARPIKNRKEEEMNRLRDEIRKRVERKINTK